MRHRSITTRPIGSSLSIALSVLRRYRWRRLIALCVLSRVVLRRTGRVSAAEEPLLDATLNAPTLSFLRRSSYRCEHRVPQRWSGCRIACVEHQNGSRRHRVKRVAPFGSLCCSRTLLFRLVVNESLSPPSIFKLLVENGVLQKAPLGRGPQTKIRNSHAPLISVSQSI